MRIILIAVIALLLYQLGISLGAISHGRGITISQENFITAEKWRYCVRKPVRVFVGSSKTACLPIKKIDSDCQLLAFHALGSLTGLEILCDAAELPEQIVVEIGSAGVKSQDEDRMLMQAADRNTFDLKDLFSLLRHEYQPLNVLYGFVHSPLDQYDLSTIDHTRAIEFVERGKDKALTPEQTSRLDVAALKIKNLICALQNRGAQLLIYDPPTEFDNSAYESSVRKRLREWFPPSQFSWIENPSMPLRTVDGIHLIGASAEKYAKFLLMSLVNVSPKRESPL